MIPAASLTVRPEKGRPELSPVEYPLATGEVDRHAVRLVVVHARASTVALRRFAELPALLAPGDLVVVNDAATLPASLRGRTATGEPFELRLAAPVDGRVLDGVLFGRGDWRTRTEHRPPPPPLVAGEAVEVAGLDAVVLAAGGRRVRLAVGDGGLDHAGARERLWHAIYAGGAPVQYAHRREPLPLWSVQTAYAARPWAVEMPSAGRPLTWEVLLGLRARGVGVAALTHAAGLGSTGDPALDAALPWPERFEVPAVTAAAIADTRARGGRVVAVGTTVARALEDGGGRAGAGVATLRLDATTRRRVVDGLVSGLHVPGESHHELLRAFAPAGLLARALDVARAHALSGHELGDGCLLLP